MPDAGLFIPGLVANNPDILFPINNWSDYIFATEPVFSDNEFQKPRRIDHLRLGGGGVSGTREVDLVLVSILSNRQWVYVNTLPSQLTKRNQKQIDIYYADL